MGFVGVYIEYVKENYKEYLVSTSIVYFEAGSGGGGNAYTIAGKFPDYFAAIVSSCRQKAVSLHDF